MQRFALADVEANLNADFSTQNSAFVDADAKFKNKCSDLMHIYV